MKNRLEVVNIRLVKEPSLYSEEILDNAAKVVDLMARELGQYDREVFCILNMKASAQVINMNIVSVGDLNTALVNPREVFKSSILSNAHGIIALHNHPSGRACPSAEDFRVTKRLMVCGELLGIELLDHIIIGSGSRERYSFHENGQLLMERQEAEKLMKTVIAWGEQEPRLKDGDKSARFRPAREKGMER